jgi:hypothetical protein
MQLLVTLKEVIPMVGSYLLPADVEHVVGFCRTGHENPSRKYASDARKRRSVTEAALSNHGERVMLLLQKFIVRKHERALLYEDGDFVAFLGPGTDRYFDVTRRYSLERFDITRPAFEHRLIDFLLETERVHVERLFEVVQTGADEAALVLHNERVAAVLAPAERKLYWKGVVAVRVERFALGTRTLDVLLKDKTAIDREIAAHVLKRFAEISLAFRSVGIKDIILPGEMRDLLAKVVGAEKWSAPSRSTVGSMRS